MTLDPLLSAPPAVQIHAAAAMLALVTGPFALWRRRRDRLHRALGYLWVTAMTAAALSSFAIPSEFTSFGAGPIHLLSVYALAALVLAMRAIYRRDIAQHHAVMEALYVRGLAMAGGFSLLPGRTGK